MDPAPSATEPSRHENRHPWTFGHEPGVQSPGYGGNAGGHIGVYGGGLGGELLPARDEACGLPELLRDAVRHVEITEWVQILKRVVARGIKAFAFANNHYAGHAPDTVKLFRKLYDEK
jgi:hypothetical protein